MKKLFVILFTIALLPPLCAQEAEHNITNELDESMNSRKTTGGNDEEPNERQETEFAKNLGRPSKGPFTYARRHFEFGYDAGVGADNGLMGINDIFKKNIELDMSELSQNIDEDGVGLNLDMGGDFFINIMNIPIAGGIWDIGVSGGADGGINFNLPEALFILMTKGNIKKHSSSGTISASGGFYADAGLSVSAKYNKLKIGVRPALYTPLLFIPKSGITYHLRAEKTEPLYLDAGGEIIMYSPLMEDDGLQFGSDLSLEGEYALFTFLDVGGSLSHIPLSAARLENGMRFTLNRDKFNYQASLNFDSKDAPELAFTHDDNYKNLIKVYRPLSFDVYARYKPSRFEFLSIKPNMGFSVDINEQEGYFNAGVEGQVHLKDMFSAHLGTGYKETIWKHRLGFALNLRAFELDIEGSLRSQNFIGSWTGQGFGLDIGMRFGW